MLLVKGWRGDSALCGMTGLMRLRVPDPASEFVNHAFIAEAIAVRPRLGRLALQPEQDVLWGGMRSYHEARVDHIAHVITVGDPAPGDYGPVGVVVDHPGRASFIVTHAQIHNARAATRRPSTACVVAGLRSAAAARMCSTKGNGWILGWSWWTGPTEHAASVMNPAPRHRHFPIR